MPERLLISELDEPPGTTGNPVRAAVGCAGTGVVASVPLAAGAVACRFHGRIVPFAALPHSEIRHALWLDSDRWLIAEAPARFINHSCDPNCALVDDPHDPDAALVVAARAIAAGEEITFAYDRVGADELAANKNNPAYAWHADWTFQCRCGAPICRGLVDGYRPKERARIAQRPDAGEGLLGSANPHGALGARELAVAGPRAGAPVLWGSKVDHDA